MCNLCKKTDNVLSMKTKLYNGFGGWEIRKDGFLYFIHESEDELDWSNVKKLEDIELEAKKSPRNKWTAHLNRPLKEAKYERLKCGSWVLIDTGIGFA